MDDVNHDGHSMVVAPADLHALAPVSPTSTQEEAAVAVVTGDAVNLNVEPGYGSRVDDVL